jgi:hypothetical protein
MVYDVPVCGRVFCVIKARCSESTARHLPLDYDFISRKVFTVLSRSRLNLQFLIFIFYFHFRLDSLEAGLLHLGFECMAPEPQNSPDKVNFP